jgi:predicted NAD-dependent protein-ADP-ribosyltransferase YbiA (DUF1768 family)
MLIDENGKRQSIISSSHISGFVGESRWLSNFWVDEDHPIYLFDLEFPSVENGYQAWKSDDPLVWKHFTTIKPWEAQKQGQEIELRANWQELRYGAMMFCRLQMFRDNPKQWKKLKRTGNKVLVESNNWGDYFWGEDWKTGRGRNELGKMTMMIRSLPDPT